MQRVNSNRMERYFAQVFVTGPFEMSEISLYTLRRSLGPQIVALPSTHLNNIRHSSAHVADYAHIT